MEVSWPEVVAVVISLIALSVSLYELLNNRPRLKTKVLTAMPVGGSGRELWVSIEVINFGRQPTTISHVYFVLQNKSGAWPMPLPNGDQPGLYLQTGEKASFIFDGAGIIEIEGKDERLYDAVFSGKLKPVIQHTWKEEPVVVAVPKNNKKRYID